MKAFQKIAVLAVIAAGLMGASAGQAEAGVKGKFHGKNHFAGKFSSNKFDHHKFNAHKFQQHKFHQNSFNAHKFNSHKFNHGNKFNPFFQVNFNKHK